MISKDDASLIWVVNTTQIASESEMRDIQRKNVCCISLKSTITNDKLALDQVITGM